MSDHDPFDGIYSSAPAPKPVEPIEDDNTEDETEHSVDTVYSSPFLRRQSKGDLQEIARAKGLDASGGRDDLIERIEADQRS